MAASFNEKTIEKYILDQHKISKDNEDQRQASAYYYLNNYNYNGSSPMVSFSWTCPTGDQIQFSTTNGEFYLNGTGYSGLMSDKKVILFKYLPQFIVKCLENYDITYNF